MKISKKKLIFVGVFPVFAMSFLISCENQLNFLNVSRANYQKFAIINRNEKTIAKPFFENANILELLAKIYDTNDSKKQLISRINAIETEKYISDLAFKFSFYNPINPWPSHSIVGGLGKKDSNPVLFEQAKKSFTDLFKNNWLWLLKNLEKTVFIRGLAEIDQFQEQNEELNINLKEKALKNSFYQPKSNKFTDIAIVGSKTEKNEENTKNEIETKNYKIFLLNEENFIFSFNLKKELKNGKLINSEINLNPWIRIYPKFLNKTDQKFPLQEYARIVSNYRTGVLGANVSLVEKSIFEENQGGNVFYYTLVDFKTS
ncbi:hypothetical protein DR095_00570 [Mycoplasma flocculare]|uniref:Lipoprotein n=2 Tax=Mesomycoplasma flocculare TaxID=2128 RepID=A0AAW9X9F7_MESFC|nr:aromatic motif membrane protein [Mesomycoplasma flocculare]MXR39394.1 hypothetical protein [Mycoplasma sp. MF12]AJC49777.1 putative lipoprotein [Mesomycoplasma flocculare ATCC 27399]ENX50772.1 hypothetical protein MFC_01315 [Mesomycoplasma flocculare ATCC 27716]MXR05808.1 hypothetical protein [Mesomycoplasma flocculare]MXR12178.1 hypothetical protein [Mesomycoplasma flocculare]